MNYETINYLGYNINVLYDESAQNPFKEWDMLGVIYQNRRGACASGKYWRLLGEFDNGHGDVDWNLIEHGYIWSKIYIYSHSGETVQMADENPFSYPWDSGLYGVIARSKEEVRKEYNVKRISPQLKKKVLDIFRNEVELLDNVLRGEVFGYVIDGPEDEDGYREEWLDSCFGFYGTDFEKNGLLDYAKSFIESHIERSKKQDVA